MYLELKIKRKFLPFYFRRTAILLIRKISRQMAEPKIVKHWKAQKSYSKFRESVTRWAIWCTKMWDNGAKFRWKLKKWAKVKRIRRKRPKQKRKCRNWFDKLLHLPTKREENRPLRSFLTLTKSHKRQRTKHNQLIPKSEKRFLKSGLLVGEIHQNWSQLAGN